VPIYHYKCQEHGSFYIHGPMGSVTGKQKCPTCGELCSRNWRADRPVITWKGPGKSGMSDGGYYHNPNIKEVEDEMYQNITEEAEKGDL